MNETPSKFTLKHSYDGSEDYSPMDVTFDIPGDATIDQMLFNFECFLKACGFVFDTKFVQSGKDEYDLPEEEESECGCVSNWNDYLKAYNEKIESDCMGKEYETPEVKKNKWVHGICNPPSPDWRNS